MNDCCNDKCNQGRDCPAQVAPVKCSYPRDEEYHTMWADDMRMVARYALGLILVFLLAIIGITTFIVN